MKRTLVILAVLAAVVSLAAVCHAQGTAKTEMKEVDSTAIKEVGYNPDTFTLTVTFANGEVYEYMNVPQTVFNELMAAESKGSYFQKNIKDKYNAMKK